MIDTHCHLLPGLDDGPRDLGEAVALARQLGAAGVETVVCTPHASRQFPTDGAEARGRLDELRLELGRAGIALALELAAEFAPATLLETTPEVLAGRAIGRRFVLVELVADTPASYLSLALAHARGAGLAPVFAHPERCRAVRDQPHLLDAARAAGALVQIVAPSLTGRSGGGASAAAWQLLATGRVDLLASDAHRAAAQRLPLAEALALVRSRHGDAVLRELTVDAPARLLGEGAA